MIGAWGLGPGAWSRESRFAHLSGGPLRTRVAALVAAFILLVSSAFAADWKPADPASRIELPRDHAAHPDAKIEWWYYTGNLTAADGRRFGYQLTFFRAGVDPRPVNPSRWAVRDLYLTHFAISDLSRGRHHYADRLNRAGVGWAGALAAGYRVWNEDWEVALDGAGRHRLRAADGGMALDLVLEEGKPAALHGESGYSRKGPSPGNASHYYSLTRMPTRGTLTVDGERVEVTGASWMDHEFGSSFLEPGQRGWDWFSVQFDDGTEMMLFQIRRGDGRADPFASGTLVDAAGRVTHLDARSFALEPGATWTSPASGGRYPVAWKVLVPGAGLALEVRAAFPAQELRTEDSTAVTYWEGAIEVSGVRAGRPLTGRGYLEMTGYAGRDMSEVLR